MYCAVPHVPMLGSRNASAGGGKERTPPPPLSLSRHRRFGAHISDQPPAACCVASRSHSESRARLELQAWSFPRHYVRRLVVQLCARDHKQEGPNEQPEPWPPPQGVVAPAAHRSFYLLACTPPMRHTEAHHDCHREREQLPTLSSPCQTSMRISKTPTHRRMQ